MSFCTAINCMDGRTQEPVIAYLKERFGADYVDSVTEAGPVLHLAESPDSVETAAILRRVDVSVTRHGSSGIALVAHHDCAGNPRDEAHQRKQLAVALALLGRHYPEATVIGLWVGPSWTVEEIPAG